jgi:MazG family protein
LSSFRVVEAYEVADYVDLCDAYHLKEELGDLLFQVVFYAQIATEKNLFNFGDIIKTLNDKLVERHPHVFADEDNDLDALEQSKVWEQNKFKDRVNGSVLDGIPANLPELLKSIKLTKRAAVIGFDWIDIGPVFDKMDEEIAELQEAMQSKRMDRIKDELGDVLFVCTNLARHLQIDPQLALRHANKKFETRFRAVEENMKEKYPDKNRFDLDTLEAMWVEVKKAE